jgi:hypothetical protein
MRGLFGQRFADAHKALVISCPWYVPGLNKPIRYGKGQGMGTKASFALAQLTDCLFIEYMFIELYDKAINDIYFMKVGDDVVLHDPDLKFKSAYEGIGVPINISKSKFKTSFGNFVEFVSRNSWNNFDYSRISPSLISRYTRNDFYLPVLFEHIKQRDTEHPTITELIGYKKDLKSSRESRDDSSRTHIIKLMKLINLMDIANGTNLLDSSERLQISSDELKQFVRNLILGVLGEFVIQTEKLLEDESLDYRKSRAEALAGEFRQLESSRMYRGYKDFFSKVTAERLHFVEVVSLWHALHVSASFEDQLSSGLDTYSRNRDLLIEPFIELKPNCSLILNPKFLEFFLNLGLKIQHQAQSHLTFEKGPNFMRARVSNTLDAYQFLNSLIDVPYNDIVDMDTYAWKGSNRILNHELTRGYSDLLNTHKYLNLLNTYETKEVQLYETELSQVS